MITFNQLEPALQAMIRIGVSGGGASMFGRTFYVNSNGGQNKLDSDPNGWGTHPTKPFDTLAFAILQCKANRGDVIFVAPGHAETIASAAAIAVSIAGVTIIGLGEGDLKPTFTYTTSAAATITTSAKNVTIYGLRFVSGIDSLAQFLTLGENYTRVINCDFSTASTFEALSFIGLTTTKDNFWIQGCTFTQPTDPAGTDGGAGTGCIYIVDSENIHIEDCHFNGCFETAIIHNRTTACKNLWVKRCNGLQLLSGAEPFALVDGATGAATGPAVFITPAATDVAEAAVVGAVGAGFFVGLAVGFGNDGGGGQLAVAGASAAS